MQKPLLLPLLLLTTCAPAPTAPTTAHALLSIEETLTLATATYDQRPSNAEITRRSRANPAARPQLYARLADPANAATWAPTVGLFAILGQSEDVPPLLALITARTHQSTPLSPADFQLLSTTLDALNAMAARKIPGAAEAVEPTLHPAFWQSLPATPTDNPALTMTARALLAYAYSNPTDLESKRTTALNELPDPAQRATLEARTATLPTFQSELQSANSNLAAHPYFTK